MKTAVKILTALAAVVGAVYVVATYGDKIVAWAKNLLASCPCCNQEVEEVVEEAAAEEAVPAADAPADQEPAAEEATADEAIVDEAEVQIVVEGNEPVAEEADFEA